jgi:hypothetical protein
MSNDDGASRDTPKPQPDSPLDPSKTQGIASLRAPVGPVPTLDPPPNAEEQRQPGATRPKYRSLAEFLDKDRKLRPAEQKLLEACWEGKVAPIGDARPTEKTHENSIRSTFLRFLALGGDEAAPVHELGVQAVGAWIEGEVDLESCKVEKPLDLKQCYFDGNLSIEGAELRGLFLDGSSIGTIIGDRARCSSSLHLRNGLCVRGSLLLIRAHVEHDVDLEAINFEKSTNDRANEIWLSGAKMGRLFFHNLEGQIDVVSLRGASTGALVDDSESWNKCGALLLDGFQYDRFLDAGMPASRGHARYVSPVDARTRIAWLDRQREEDRQQDFKPQPWEQLIKVLRDTGHYDEAREVAMEKQRRLRQVGRISYIAIPLHWLFGLFVGYGYRPLRAVAIVLAVWIGCALFYQIAAGNGVFAPSNARVLADLRYEPCWPQRGGNWTDCKYAPLDAANFNAFAYSLDLILPPLDLQQKREWMPMVRRSQGLANLPIQVNDDLSNQTKTVISRVSGWWCLGVATRLVMWSEIIFGWTASLLLAAILAGLIKKD